MSNVMRAKMKVASVRKFEGNYEQLELTAVMNGTTEDNTFAAATPSATLTMMITNPALIGTFTPGQKLYVDFSIAE